MNDMIEIYFLPEEENITWKIRPQKKINEESNENTSSLEMKKIKNQISEEERMLPKLLAKIDLGLSRLNEVEYDSQHNEIKTFLKENLRILTVNCNDKFCGEKIIQIIPKIKECLSEKRNCGKSIVTKQNYVVTNKNNKGYHLTGIYKTPRTESEIKQKLEELNKEINSSLSIKEREEFRKLLESIEQTLRDDETLFKKDGSRPIKFNQIKDRLEKLSKLEENNKSMSKLDSIDVNDKRMKKKMEEFNNLNKL